MIEAITKLSEINQRLPDPPSWSKEMSFAAYRRLVENWENTVQNKYGKKAHLLLKEIENNHVHVGLTLLSSFKESQEGLNGTYLPLIFGSAKRRPMGMQQLPAAAPGQKIEEMNQD